MGTQSIFVGTAGWSIASLYANAFPEGGTHLERYARRLNCAEINTSFYRPHNRKTYERWAVSVPQHFRFSVKLPKEITHERRLAGCSDLLRVFIEQAGGLGEKLGALLVQLPPNLALDLPVAKEFFAALRDMTAVAIVCEPHHKDWFSPEADHLLKARRVARVAADPPRVEGAGEPAGWGGVAYFRMHGSPRVYYSDYDAASIQAVEERVHAAGAEAKDIWCIFDNTAASHALGNAMDLAASLGGSIEDEGLSRVRPAADQITFSSRNGLASAMRA